MAFSGYINLMFAYIEKTRKEKDIETINLTPKGIFPLSNKIKTVKVEDFINK